MQLDFKKIKYAVALKFSELANNNSLFRTSVSGDELWDLYLKSFPEGTNPIYRERTEHDCSCCKQFIRNVGNVVGIVDGKIVSIWDCKVNDTSYQVVVNALAKKVKSHKIADIFLSDSKTAGTDRTFEEITDGVRAWDHFFVSIPSKFYKNRDLYSAIGEARAVKEVLARGLSEITMDAIDTVIDLISQNSLYRGEEHLHSLQEFKAVKRDYDAITNAKLADNFVWLSSRKLPVSVSKMRNTVIGTLLTDISEGVMSLEDAVNAFEYKVAPMNYKRPTAIVTPKMVENAKEKILELGLLSSLERRYANIADININNVLFADRTAKKIMGADVFDEISSKTKVKKPRNLDKIEEVNIDKFISDILPKAESVELYVENKHINNLVSLIAPVDPTAGKLFKWDNNFSWSYNGDVTDSIKERVKQAGGVIEGDLCCRLAWFNYDDLDIHLVEPNGNEIYYCNKNDWKTGGTLDVDMNAGSGKSRNAVENIFFKTREKMIEGIYKLRVNNYCRRETIDVGFEVEIDYQGKLFHFSYPKAVGNKETVTVAEFSYTHAKGFELLKSLPESSISKEVWGINTENYHKVSAIMFSPNYWGEKGIGNKHYFFMLADCKNEGTARGFYNEFLKSDLDQHRKVFEIVGSKMKTQETEDQLSGIGFSSTQNNSVLCRISGSFSRIVKVLF